MRAGRCSYAAPRRVAALALLLALALVGQASATTSLTLDDQTPSAALTLSLVPLFTGLDSPVFVTSAGDGSGRLFVVERPGVIRLAVDGELLDAPFLDIRAQVHTDNSEQGLLGLAFAPDYAQSGVFYVYYTALDGADTLLQLRVSDDPNRADPDSAAVVFALPDREPNHNGGMLAFGPDGHLYIGIGDEGGHDDQYGNGQNLTTLFGKLLRIDPRPGGGYDIPADNPCATVGAACRPEIWAYGLRNPWRFTFDRATGDLYIADVGEAEWEEIDIQPPGATALRNYGWNRVEGGHCFPAGSACSIDGVTLPAIEYSHDLGCSVSGGYVYRGARQPALAGAYLFGDYCSGRVWFMRDGVVSQALQTALNIVSFGEDEAGELYVVDIGHDHDGGVYRLVASTAVQRTWLRDDLPVRAGQADRTWMWGPQPDSDPLTEAYAEAPGGRRTVQYFDKSRMEITQPESDPNATWHVTNGLLAKELITGNMQLGDIAFAQREPAQINVAGDPADPDAPTYASLRGLLDAPPAADGATLIQRVDRAGNVTNDPSLAGLGATAAYRVTVPGIDHQIASVFWEFMNSSALVYQDGVYVNAPLFENPFYATGYPITEAYWATVDVAGTPQDVLTQCFERRCLTWTPDNPPGWQVEAGNVGQHYYRWRYGDTETRTGG